MSEASNSASAAAAESYRRAIDSYRSVARWVLSSFGAVAAALVVALPLSSLGDLDGVGLGAAIFCVLLVFLLILYVVRTASEVLEPMPPVGRADLAKQAPFFQPLNEFIEENRSMLGWDDIDSAAELKAKYDDLREQRKTAWAAYAVEQTATNKKELDEAGERAEEVRARLDLLVTFGSALRMKQLYRRAMNRVYVSIGIAIAAAILFACLSSSASDSSSTQAADSAKHSEVHVTVGGPRLLDWPRSCARLYFALDKLAAAETRAGPLWPEGSLSNWDRACGLRSRADVTRALAFLGHR